MSKNFDNIKMHSMYMKKKYVCVYVCVCIYKCNFLFQSNWAPVRISWSPAVPKLPVAS